MNLEMRGHQIRYDIIGDVHGCHHELVSLLERLGYDTNGPRCSMAWHPEGRTAVFTGDLVDRGPEIPRVLGLVMNMVEEGDALCVLGNHDDKLRRALAGNPVTVNNGLMESLAQLAREPEPLRGEAKDFISSLPDHLSLDEGRLIVAHAGLPERLHGRSGKEVRHHALYGDTTGETDEDGHPICRDWVADYTGAASVVYGHEAVSEAVWRNNTICVDTGCVFGGKLTALRWPERELVSVDSTQNWRVPR